MTLKTGIFFIGMVMLFMLGFHLTDIGQITLGYELTNGFWTADSIHVYHIGLYLEVICFAIMTLYAFRLKFPNKKPFPKRGDR